MKRTRTFDAILLTPQAGTRPPLSVTLVRPLPTSHLEKQAGDAVKDGRGGRVRRRWGRGTQVDPVEEGRKTRHARRERRLAHYRAHWTTRTYIRVYTDVCVAHHGTFHWSSTITHFTDGAVERGGGGTDSGDVDDSGRLVGGGEGGDEDWTFDVLPLRARKPHSSSTERPLSALSSCCHREHNERHRASHRPNVPNAASRTHTNQTHTRTARHAPAVTQRARDCILARRRAFPFADRQSGRGRESRRRVSLSLPSSRGSRSERERGETDSRSARLGVAILASPTMVVVVDGWR